MSFDEFYRKYAPALKRYVLHLGASRDEAEDVVQEVMSQAWRNWHTLDKPLPWCYRAASSEFSRIIRRRRHEDQILRAIGREPSPAGHSGEPSAAEPSSEQLRRVRSLLRLLPPAQREVLALTYDGFKPIEIAQIVGKTAETVRANLREARKRLRQELEGEI